MVTSRGPSAAPGFTLLEGMLTVAIIGVVVMIGPRLLTQFNRFFILTNTRTSLQREARTNMYVINRNLRQAQADTILIDRLSGQPYYSRITFTKQQGNTMQFYQSGTSLIQVDSGKSKTLTTNLRYMAFSFPRSDDLSIVSVSMTLEKAIYDYRTKALHMASEKVRVMN